MRSLGHQIFFVLVCMTFSACTSFPLSRSESSGHSARRVAAVSPGGSLKFEVQRLEQSLTNRRDLEQYSRVLPWFEGLEERYEFLSLPGLEARAEWLRDRNFFERPLLVEKQMLDLIQARDIAVGMPESLVKKSWGEPDVIEVSGHPLFKNMRWRYLQQEATEDGFVQQKKSVYIEGGKVTGWDSDI